MSETIIKREEQEFLEEEICVAENLVYSRPKTLTDLDLHYCPGCGHGVVHRLMMEVIEELDIQEKTIGVAPVGCSVFAYQYMDVDMQEAAHGRATAVATGIKRVLPDRIVFSYQGDGDLAAIGTAETLHTCNRGESIVIIFINNAIYGMTSGQMAPTTVPGMVTTTSPYGRDVKLTGYPLKITELVAQLPGTYFVTRQAVNNPSNVRKAKKAIRKAFEYVQLNRGTCFVEIVSNCPSNWKMTPVEANKYVEEVLIPFYPLGDIKVPQEESK